MKAGKEIKAGQEAAAYAQAMDWSTDAVMRSKSSERKAWVVAGAAVMVALPAVIGLAWSGPLHTSYPVVIAVDKTTGNMEVAELSNERQIAELPQVLDAFWAKKYVIARESYYYPLLQVDYDTTLALSADDVGMDYAKQFNGVDALDKKYTDRYQVKISVISVVLPKNEKGKAVVRYTRSLRQVKTAAIESEQTYVATFSFEYKPSQTGAVAQLMNNPLGYHVTAYRTDAELAPRLPESKG
jgi:type IV secretion system protein VirB8